VNTTLNSATGLARGVSEGPLKTLIPVFIDVETFMTPEINLGRMTLRKYLATSHVLSLAVAVGEVEPQVFELKDGEFKPADASVVASLAEMASNPKYVFVAHNAAFDIRVLRFKLGIPQPKNVWCTQEGAMGAWPELPGGYSLKNIPEVLCFPKTLRKTEINLEACTPEELTAYNKQDVAVMQEIYYRQVALIPADEQEVALRTHRQRQFYFEVDPDRLDRLLSELEKQATLAEGDAAQYVSDFDHREIFNRDNGSLHSVRSQRLLKISRAMGANIDSTSLKKASPTELAKHPEVAELLTQAGLVNKMLSHKRRATIFVGVNQVDVELGYFRATTGRFASPAVGKGLNIHNIPKHDKALAKPVRQMFRLPEGLCFVRGDLANVEYRVEGKLTGCKTVLKMFDQALGGDPFNDPYCMAWLSMTGQQISKKDSIRQVAKAAVLGLGFCMGPTGYGKTLLTAMSDRRSGITEEVLSKIAEGLGWPRPGYAERRIIERLGCSATVANAAYHIHSAFNQAHQEFGATASWLVDVVGAVASSVSKDQAKYLIDRAYTRRGAPNRNMIDLSIDEDRAFHVPSVRVRCGPWVRTICWREPKLRRIMVTDEYLKLSIIKSTGQFKPFTTPLAIENVTQAAARNMLCWGVAELEKLGFPDVIHIHDEILIITPRNRDSVLAAREALLKVFGPGGNGPLGWATLIKPNEISVTGSLFEDEMDIAPRPAGGDRWERIEGNETGCLEDLP